MRRLFSSESDLYLSAKVDVIAHWGASGYMPDHMLPTYKSAFESGSDWIELDAQCNKVSSLLYENPMRKHTLMTHHHVASSIYMQGQNIGDKQLYTQTNPMSKSENER
jgi:hypothetical protein